MNHRLHGCADVHNWNAHDYARQDADCLQSLGSYDVSNVIAHGANGLVLFAVVEQDKAMAVKIVAQTPDSLREVYMSCRVDQTLAPRLTAFARTYGWVACGAPPANWKREIDRYYAREHQYPPVALTPFSYYLVSDLGGNSLKQQRFESVEQCKSVVFEVFYAMHQAFEREGFVHGDLHRGNVLVRFRRPRRYTVGGAGLVFRVTERNYPQIIDFEDASFDNDPAYAMKDARFFLRSLSKFDAADQLEPVAAFIMTRLVPLREAHSLEQVLLGPAFESLRNDEGDGDEIASVECHVCGSVASTHFAHAPSFAFCGAQCAAKMGRLAQMLHA